MPRVAIRAEGLSKRFGDFEAVVGLDFEVGEGEIFGLLGPNGAGKTTTVRLLAGLISASGGRAEVAGRTASVADAQLRRKVGVLTEQPGLYDRLSALDNLRYFGRLHGLSAPEVEAGARRWLTQLGLWERREERTATFSKGMKQKLAIARALLHEPPVLFLDEPTSGLDPAAAKAVRDVVAGLAAGGRAVVLCTHNLFEAEALCRRVGVLKTRLLAIADIADLRRSGESVAIELGAEAAGYVRALSGLLREEEIRADGRRLILRLEGQEQVPRVVGRLVAEGAAIHSVVPAVRSLEEAYLELIGESPSSSDGSGAQG